MWHRQQFSLKPRSRGFHLVTDEILGALSGMNDIRTGLLHLQLMHTSASLTLNENADPTVRSDFAASFDALVREDEPYYKHTLEGSDDMPAHIKAALVGSSVSMPIANGQLGLGTWQGIYLCEFRNRGGARSLVATIID